MIQRSTGLVNKLTERHHRAPIASRPPPDHRPILQTFLIEQNNWSITGTVYLAAWICCRCVLCKKGGERNVADRFDTMQVRKVFEAVR